MKTKRLKFGTPVYHAKFGTGTIRGEWGPMPDNANKGRSFHNSCEGVYDVIFERNGEPFLHCCNIIHLRIEP